MKRLGILDLVSSRRLVLQKHLVFDIEAHLESSDCSLCGSKHSSFTYAPLKEGRGIRLFLLQAGQPNDEIHCTLWNTFLDDEKVVQEGYVALSYVWGNPSPPSTIFCNGICFHITKNLEDALHVLRRPDEQRTLWIDQICINQVDNDERCAQVQIMRHIYQKANRVIARLGAATPQSKLALDFALELLGTSQEVFQADSKSLVLGSSGLPELQLKGCAILLMLGGENPGWLALQHFFEQAWFSRIWVVQEVMMANNLILHCGADTVRWEVLVELGKKLGLLYILSPKIFRGPSTACGQFLILIAEKCKEERTLTLHKLLVLSRAHASTDARDKIYALLGLIKNASDYGIIPDYNISVAELFQNTTKVIFEDESSLQLLSNSCSIRTVQRLAGLSSWCPDCPNYDASEKYRRQMGWDDFQADGGLQVFFTWHKDPSLLTLRGKVIDIVSDQSVLFDPQLFNIVNEEQLKLDTFIHYRSIAVLLDSCKQIFLASTSLSNDDAKAAWYWRALIGGLDINGNLADGIYAQHLEYYEKYVRNAASGTNYEDVNGITMAWSQEQKEGSVAFARSLLQAGSERRFTLTKNGRLGWLPESARNGDRLAIRHGRRMPWVIRLHDHNTYYAAAAAAITVITILPTMLTTTAISMAITIAILTAITIAIIAKVTIAATTVKSIKFGLLFII